MAQGPFPETDAAEHGYFNAAVPYLSGTATATRLGIPPAKVTAITNALTIWNTAYGLSINPATRTSTVTKDKNDAKDVLENLLRGIYADFPESALTNIDRDTLNIKERAAGSRAPVPDSRPICKVDTSKSLEHTVSFTDENAAGSRAKPLKVHGCEIWHKIGEAPVNVKELTYLATDTKTPYVAHFEGEDVGKNVYYRLRWVNAYGEPGPWSEVVVATITA